MHVVLRLVDQLVVGESDGGARPTKAFCNGLSYQS